MSDDTYGLTTVAYDSVLSMKNVALGSLENAGFVTLQSFVKLPASLSLSCTMLWYRPKGHEEPGPSLHPTTGYTTSFSRMRMYAGRPASLV
jgi:hypothetical protein